MATAISSAEARAEAERLAVERAALRRVATLVAAGVPSAELFSAVTKEVAYVFSDVDPSLVASVIRFDRGPESVLVGASRAYENEPLGARWAPKDLYVSTRVLRTGSPARVDEADLDTIGGPDADVLRLRGFLYQVGSPVVVEGQLWGAMCLSSKRELPPNTDDRLETFTELVATAIANAESREAIVRLADEQAALHRVATLVAQDTAPAEIFAAVSAEVDRVFHLDPATFDVAVVGRFDPGPELVIVGISKSVDVIPLGSRWPPDELFAPTHVLHTGRSARIGVDDLVATGGEVAGFLRHHGYLSQVASPIVVNGRLWGAMSVNSGNDLPPDTDERLERFTELVATAIANAESRETLARLAHEQAALRRVATLVAEGAPPDALFRAVVDEVALVVGPPTVTLSHHHANGSFSVVAATNNPGFPVGSRWPLDGPSLAATIHETGRVARIDDYSTLGGAVAAAMHDASFRAAAGSPIVVDGKVWGHISVTAKGAEPLPTGTEKRLLDFTELIATAIANAESRDALARLAAEQAALRRVATLVARDTPPGEVFDAVAMEVGKLLDTDITVVGRYDGDGAATAIGSWSASPGGVPVGTRSVLGGRNVLTLVAETARPARVDGYDDASGDAAEIARRHGWRSSIAAPIIVEDRLWGVMLVATQRPDPFPAAAEERLAAFTDLVATAVANTEARHALERVAAEQAALRRVATLVAQGASPQDLFDAVAAEVGRLLPAANVSIGRYESDDSVTSMASWSSAGPVFTPGVRWPIKGTNVAWMVLQTGRPARIDDFSVATDPIGVAVREAGYKSAIGCPIVVEGHLWGAISAASIEGPMPPGGEARLASFTELVATAIANAESSAELAASRRRIVTASDDARRRIERDLHDGVQQQLVSLGLELGAMKADPPTGDVLQKQLAGVTKVVSSVLDALVETARGIHPAILSHGGLAAALRALARRSAVPVELDAQLQGPISDDVEVAAYYVAAEALTNAAKHARASVVHMEVTTDDGTLTLMVRDDGVGGADAGRGSGLVGLQDRVEALGGTIKIDSSAGSGTCVIVTLPITTEQDREIEHALGPPQELGSVTSPA